ncbi:MAG TPA: amino acid permease [Prolixibacteraceae bacterium]|nr:amino acid permease [Prolixibacteraceae bacterium]
MTGEHKFRRKIKVMDATAIVIGSMIGSGVFIVSSDIARGLGSPGWLLLVWLISGLLTVFAAVSYGELASLIPDAGGQYVYLREIYNPLIGFLFGWALFMVIQAGSIAAVSMAFGKFLGVIFPWFSESHTLFSLGLIKFNTVHIAAITSVIFLTWLNTRGIVAGKLVQNLFSVVKVGILLFFIFAGIFFARNFDAIQSNWHHFWEASKVAGNGSVALHGWPLVAAIGTSMVGALFALDGWNNITFTAAETRNPKRTIPLSLIYGSLTVAILYFFTNVVYLMALPLNGTPDGLTVFQRGISFATDDRIGTASMEGIFGGYAALIMAFFVVISTFGCNNGMVLSGARVYYAMAKDNLFFKSTGKLNKHGVPANGLILQCIWTVLLCLSGTYGNLLDYVIATVLLFYMLSIAGVFIMRKRYPDAKRKYKAFGYPVIPAIYIICTLFINILLLIYKPSYTWPGLAIVLSGVPVYFIWKKINQKQMTNPK